MTVGFIAAAVFFATIPASLIVIAWAVCKAADLGDRQDVIEDPFESVDAVVFDFPRNRGGGWSA